MRILRAADHKRMPWKNGGGETVEIAVFPPHASVDDFGWRISMATVACDGPFSAFTDIDRTISLLSGEGLSLSVAGQGSVRLQVDSAPYSFPADVPTTASLMAGPVTDLNVMSRRGMFRHRVTRLVSRRVRLGSDKLTLAIGLLPLRIEGNGVLLGRLDAVILPPRETVVLSGEQDTTIFVVEMEATDIAQHQKS